MTLPSFTSEAQFYRHFLRLASINIVSNLMVPLASLIDIAFLGHLSDIRHLAGVAIATVLFNVLYWTFGFLRMGTTGTTAQAVGRSDWDEIVVVGLRYSVMALAIALGLLILQSPLRTIGFALLSASETVKASGQAYYSAMIWGAPANLLNFVLLGWFLGRGQGRKVLVLSIIGNGSNVLLNYLFIVQLGWGSAGAGWATAASQIALAIAGVGLVAKEVSLSQIQRVSSELWRWADLKPMLMLNSDIMVRTLALLLTFSLFTNLSSAIGTVVLASHTLMLQLISFSAYFIDGIAFATESYAGILRGQGQVTRLVPLLKLAGGIAVGIGMVVALAAIAIPEQFFGLLTSHTPVLDHIQTVVGWLLPVLGIGAIAYVLDGYFLGLTQGRVLRNAALLSAIVGFLPLAMLARHQNSDQILWLALASFMAARVMTLLSQVPKTLLPTLSPAKK